MGPHCRLRALPPDARAHTLRRARILLLQELLNDGLAEGLENLGITKKLHLAMFNAHFKRAATAHLSVASDAAAQVAANKTAAAKPKAVGEWTRDDVLKLFEERKLGAYYNTIISNDVDGPILQVTRFAHRCARAHTQRRARILLLQELLSKNWLLEGLGMNKLDHAKLKVAIAEGERAIAEGAAQVRGLRHSWVSVQLRTHCRTLGFSVMDAAHVRLIPVQARVRTHVVPGGASVLLVARGGD